MTRLPGDQGQAARRDEGDEPGGEREQGIRTVDHRLADSTPVERRAEPATIQRSRILTRPWAQAKGGGMEGALLTVAVLACPVGMGLMMWFMGKRSRRHDQDAP